MGRWSTAIVQDIEIWPYKQMVYAHNAKSIPENVTHKLLLDFKIQTDHLISVRRPDIAIGNKKKKKKEKKKKEEKKKENLPNSIFCSPCRPQSKIECKQER